MTRILVCGLCPLSFENTLKNYGPGIRTWQFALSLAHAGHDVHLIALKIPDAYQDGDVVPEREERDGIAIRRLEFSVLRDVARLRREIMATTPEAAVGATIYGSYAIAQTDPEVPFWADQFGHVMAEAQAKAALDGEDGVLPYFWEMVRAVSLRADMISGVSERQRYALIGELGAVGRLNARTCGIELVHTIPCAFVQCERDSADPAPGPASVRGEIVPDDAFVVLWSGGYNVWSDVDGLFEGLVLAMRAAPEIHFLSTGAEITGHDDGSYRRLKELTSSSLLAPRFHLCGWVQKEALSGYRAAADLGVVAERAIYEGLLGSKNRVVEWMGHGLPVLYNRIGDLGDLLEDERLGLTFSVGNAGELADRILWARENRGELADMARRARQVALSRFSFDATTAPLQQWVSSPSRTPGPVCLDPPMMDRGGRKLVRYMRSWIRKKIGS